MDERFVYVDVETAGLKEDSQIIQIAAIAVDGRLNELEAFEVKVRFDIEQADSVALALNSFEPTVWKRLARRPEDAAMAFSRFLRRHATVDLFSPRTGRPYRVAQLVSHNAVFDGPKLQEFYARLDLFLPAARRVYCTLQRAYWLFAEDQSLTPPANYKLTTLCEYFGVKLDDAAAHDALHDVRATLELYRAMKQHASVLHAEAA